MNITFWVLMVVMLLLAIGILVLPLLKVRRASSIAYKESNLKLYDEKVKELDLDLNEGRIDQVFYKVAREELDRELLTDIPEENQETAALHYSSQGKRHPAIAIMVSVFVPMLAMLLYLELGMQSASDENFVASQAQSQNRQSQSTSKQPSVEEMVSHLEQRIEQNGGTLQEWTMLARSNKYLGRYELAKKAYDAALEKDPNNAQLMLEAVEVMALNNNRSFTPEARKLALKAYAIQPDNVNALWFAGVAEYQYKNYRQAIDHLTALLPKLAGIDDQTVKQTVVAMVAKSRENLIAAGEEVPELNELIDVKTLARAESQPVKVNAASSSTATSSTTLTVNVDVSEEVRKKFNANDAVFVYAKAKQGPRMPLAVQRMTLSAIPATVTLDDSMAMVQGMNLSAFDKLEVSARLTKTGTAIAQSGDYIGSLTVEDKSRQTTLNIVIDTVIP